MKDPKETELRLDSFDQSERLDALNLLKKSAVRPPQTGFVNLHCHTFFSFNAYGYSPSHIAWKALQEGLEVVGVVDFDVLDGADEMRAAGEILGVKTVAGLETRVAIPEYADRVINSPGEKGVAYFIGIGIGGSPEPETNANGVLATLRATAEKRNLSRLSKINALLGDIRLSYEKDVLPLTPLGNATERHIFQALIKKAEERFGKDRERLADFWSTRLKEDKGRISSAMRSLPGFLELLRARLIKEISHEDTGCSLKSFPALEEVIGMIRSMGGLPTAAWLDGTNEGEKDIRNLLEFLRSKGVGVLNVIPDRNWNIQNAEEKKIKVKNLDIVIRTARDLGFPLIAGTEMNKYGQKFVDDFLAPELNPYLEDFQNGAAFVYGHAEMARIFGKGYESLWANRALPDESRRRRFFTEAGELIRPGWGSRSAAVGEEIKPGDLIALLKTKRGKNEKFQ